MEPFDHVIETTFKGAGGLPIVVRVTESELMFFKTLFHLVRFEDFPLGNGVACEWSMLWRGYQRID